jgi:molybdate/tungstate transport system substrate-binding protein
MPRAFRCLFWLVFFGCSTSSEGKVVPGRDTVVVYGAASLAGPMRAALDSFSRRTGAVVSEEHGASLELARRITELHRIPDVIALADQEVFPELLMPGAMSWYAQFARNRMVIAYTNRSRHAAEVTPASWRSVVLRNDVLLGRTDPALAPAGYRALIVYQLAERFYGEPGLAARLEAKTPPGLLRGNAAELAALLSAGELDYIIDYESLARAQKFSFIQLPPDIDLGDPAHASAYASAAVRVATGRDTVNRRGAPILYGISVPRAAPHAAAGARFVQFLLGSDGRTILRQGYVDPLEHPQLVGDSVPATLRASIAP